MYIAKLAHIVGDSSPTIWGQTYHAGNLFIVLELAQAEFQTSAASQDLSVESGVETSTSLQLPKQGKEFLEDLIYQIQTSPPRDLATLESVVSATFIHGQDLRINLIIGFLVGDILYALISGQGKILLSRGKELGLLLKDKGSVSGRIQEGDHVFFLSPSFSIHIQENLIKQSLMLSLEEMQEQFGLILHSQPGFGAAGIIARIEKRPDEEKETLTENDEAVEPTLPQIAKRKTHTPLFLGDLRFKLALVKRELFRRFSGWSRKKRLTAIALTCLICFFLASIMLNWQKNQRENREKVITAQLDATSLKLSQGRGLTDINLLRAKTVLAEAKAEADLLAKTVKPGTNAAKRLSELQKDIAKALTGALRIYHLADVPVFYDLSIIKNESQGVDFAIDQNTLAILDSKNNVLYTLAVDKKRGEIVAGGDDFVQSKHIAVFGDLVFVLTDRGVMTVNSRTKEKHLAISHDDAWGEIADMDSFAGNVYLVDATHNAIWKYQATETGFGERLAYVPDDASHSFNPRTHLAIDGAVWTVSGDRIVKFMQGRPEGGFALSGLDASLSSNTSIYTNDSLPDLYFLDTGNKRIVVANKQGEYQEQYVWDKLSEAKSMVVAGEPKKILLLIGNKIYGIELR